MLVRYLRNWIIVHYEVARLGRTDPGAIPINQAFARSLEQQTWLQGSSGEYILQGLFFGIFWGLHLLAAHMLWRKHRWIKWPLIIYPLVAVFSVILFNIGLVFSAHAWINTARTVFVLLQSPALLVLMWTGEQLLNHKHTAT